MQHIPIRIIMPADDKTLAKIIRDTLTEFKANKPGVYFIALEQNMRDSAISGIQSIGIKVKEGNPVF